MTRTRCNPPWAGDTYNQNGDVLSRTKDDESYTFTYTDFLKVETISRGFEVLHRFGYDANGKRVSERRSTVGWSSSWGSTTSTA